MPASPNTFVWYELMTTDIAAEAFYQNVVGWTPQVMEGPGMRYTIMSAGGRPVAGLVQANAEMCEAGARPGWRGYMGVPDVDAATARLKQSGGTVHREPDDIPGVGRFSLVTDPQGAGFVLFTPNGGDNSPAAAGTPGHVGWHELYTTDWPSAFAFYAEQFGWTKARSVDMGPMGTYQLFAAADVEIGGMMNKPETIPTPAWTFYFVVDAIDAAITRLSDGGGRVVHGPHEVPGGSWIVQAMDPQGVPFALVAPRR
jgi:predicted enzyme related to lactoylglutathione lyase